MTKVIVTTTINPPTQAIRVFDRLPDWHLVVVGDKKTPENYKIDNGTYLSPDDQDRIDKNLSELIGWNCIQRRNFGLIFAHEMGAEVVAVVDDDNIPLEGWGASLMLNRNSETTWYETGLPAFDPVGATNYPHLWHRGFPLQLLPHRDYSKSRIEQIKPTVQADFWNGDPDIDAICRMEHAPQCTFDEKYFPMTSNAIAPFNSQNTFISGEILCDYFLFPGIGRMDDIWAAYYIQSLGARVVFNRPSVIQKRNLHDSIEDMKNEYFGYENNLALVETLVESSDSIFKLLPAESSKAFDCYGQHF